MIWRLPDMTLMKCRRIDKTESEFAPIRIRALSVGAQAIGALAVGALAIGALALGAVAIGRIAIGRAKIKRMEINELVVKKLRITILWKRRSTAGPNPDKATTDWRRRS